MFGWIYGEANKGAVYFFRHFYTPILAFALTRFIFQGNRGPFQNPELG